MHVPVPPLAWDEGLGAPHRRGLTAWARGRGFEVLQGNEPLGIEGVALEGDVVRIRCAAEVRLGAMVGYAVTSDGTARPGGTWRWGQLRDSGALASALTGAPQPNYCVAFELPVE
jgi:hypothetical protein